MKKIQIFILIMTLSFYTFANNIEPSNYPHWNLNNPQNVEKLQKIELLIEQSKTVKNPIAIFDWDGTLSNEILPNHEILNDDYQNAPFALSGQADYFTWVAKHAEEIDGEVFPLWNKTTIKNPINGEDITWKQGVYDQVQMLEGHTNVETDGYENFVLNSMGFLGGMSLSTFNDSVDKFLEDPEFLSTNTLFFKQLDILQRLRNAGISCYILTGSSPYFVAEILKKIEKDPNVMYGDVNYNFSNKVSGKVEDITTIPSNIMETYVIGNAAVIEEVDGEKTYSNRYNNFWTQNNNGSSQVAVIDGPGKEIAAINLEKIKDGNVIFVAGNSNGDYDDMKYMLEKTTANGINGLGMIVNAHGDKLIKLYNDNKNRIINTVNPILTTSVPSGIIVSLSKGDIYELTAWSEPVIAPPTETIATITNLVYSSSDPTVLDVDHLTGKVTAINNGNATINVSYTYRIEGDIKDNILTSEVLFSVQ